MLDGILDMVHNAITSPWFYLALFAFACIDAFFPAVPSESLVITAGVYAVSGEPNLALAIGCAAAGAFIGDHISWVMGRLGRGKLTRGLKPGTKRHRAYDWAGRTMAERGGLILVVARYIPGGRTAVTMTMGAVGYPARKFTPFAALAAISWGCYGGAIGYVGGHAFEDEPHLGLLVGLGIAVAITAAVEGVRHLRKRRSRRAQELQEAGKPRELVHSER